MMAQTQLTWYGQSGFKIVTPGGKVLLIDPWLTNPVFAKGKDELAALKDVDLILLSHGHSDHVGNAVEIGKKTGAKLVANFDLSAVVNLPESGSESGRGLYIIKSIMDDVHYFVGDGKNTLVMTKLRPESGS